MFKPATSKPATSKPATSKPATSTLVTSTRTPPLNRRDFIKVSVSSAGGLMLGFKLPALAAVTPYQTSANEISAEINAWLTIDPDNTVTIRVAQAEMGQGVWTSLPMIVAEELEADWQHVKVEYADANRHLRENKVYVTTGTGGSRSIRGAREYLQRAGAEARERLITAAAQQWGVSPAECYADKGRIYHREGDESLSFGEIAPAAAAVTLTTDVQLKSPKDYTSLGRAVRRLDVPAKVNGTAIYGIDVRRPGMVYATVVHSPVPGGRLRRMKFDAIRRMPGVIKAVPMEHAVGVVAEHFWQAKQAADALPVVWHTSKADETDDEMFTGAFVGDLDGEGELLVEQGDVATALDAAHTTIEADYHAPYLAHATMEPLNCTVHVQPGDGGRISRVDVWVGAQHSARVLEAVARVSGIPTEDVYVHNCFLGGGFGRRSNTDFVEEATRIAMTLDRPVQMIWTREEDMRAGMYRPMSVMRFSAGFDQARKLTVFTNHSVTHSVLFDHYGMTKVDPTSVEGLKNHPYAFPVQKLTHTRRNTHLPTWWWRSVGSSQNGYTMECFVDELAEAAGRDPFDYRRELLAGKAEFLKVLDLLEQKSGWGRSLPRGTALGMAIHESFGTICGQVAEVTVGSKGQVRVNRVVAAVDCGNLVNPLTATEQVESGVVFGLTAALYGKLTIKNGAVQEGNFDSYKMVRMHEAPEIDVHWALSGGDKWGGLGEPGTPVIAPAVCNALYRITGVRIRRLPIMEHDLSVA